MRVQNVSDLMRVPLVVAGAILPAGVVVAAGAVVGLARGRGRRRSSGHQQFRRQGHRLLAGRSRPWGRFI